MNFFFCLCALACDWHALTLRSVLTPTVSRKLTGLRSRTMALGSEGSGSASTLMTAMSFCCPKFGSPCWKRHDRKLKSKHHLDINKNQKVCRSGSHTIIKVWFAEFLFWKDFPQPFSIKQSYTNLPLPCVWS